MLLLIPASIAVHRYELAALLLGLLFLAGAALLLLAGFWLRFRWVNVVSLGLCGLAGLLCRVFVHTPRLNLPVKLLTVMAVALGLLAAWRTLAGSATGAAEPAESPTDTSSDSSNRLRLRKRHTPK